MSKDHSTTRAFLVAGAAIGLCVLVWQTVLVHVYGHPFPLLLFLVAATAVARLGGVKAGVFALILGSIAGVCFYFVNYQPDFPTGLGVPRIVSFVVLGGAMVYIVGSLLDAERRLEARQRQLEEQRAQLAEQRAQLEAEVRARAQMELAVREREERVRMAVESADIGTWDLNVLTGERQWSARTKVMFGMPMDADPTPVAFLQHLHPDDRERTAAAIQKALDPRGDGRYEIDYRIYRPDGSLGWVVAKGQAFFDGEGSQRRPVRFIGTVLDITCRKEMEESLKQADRRKSEFLAVLAHELRGPMAPLRNALQIWPTLSDRPDEAAQLRGMMTRQIDQLSRLTDDLLDVARINHGQLALRQGTVDLADVVSAAVEMNQHLIDRNGYQLRVSLPQMPLLVEGDAARLTQVVSNLLHNATKHSDLRGAIELSGEQQGDEAVVRVRDHGTGIPAQMLDHIFELFRQSDPQPGAAYAGLGVGLHLAKRIVEMHGGTIVAHSDGAGQGAEIIIRLPMLAAAPISSSTNGNSGKHVGAACGRRILIVDDDKALAETFAVILRSRGHEVSCASDGLAAINWIADNRPDVVFLDLAMPGMDGCEVAQRVRARSELSDVVLVALTGFGDAETRHLCEAAGFNHFVIKTADIEELEQVIQSAPAARQMR